MRLLTVLARALALLFLMSAAAHAQDPFQLAGFTSDTFLGDTGVLGFTQACQVEFGAAARMCTSVEVMETVVVPDDLVVADDAWVRPVFVPGATDALDASSVRTSPLNLTCVGWRLTSGRNGLTVSQVGGFVQQSCEVARPVACCAPTKLPKAKKRK